MDVTIMQETTGSGRSKRPEQVRVWDIGVRIFHWSLVAAFAGAWLSADVLAGWHEKLGYAILVLVGFRLVWGFAGGAHARFRDFVTSPAMVLAYLRAMRAGTARRYLGHNPAGGAMILALLSLLLLTGVTGWMMTTESWWGVEWVEDLHELAANSCLGLIGVHVAGVIHASRTHGENLVAAMFTGLKRRS